MIKLPIEIGDILLVGRFKNKRIKVKEIGTDEHGLPTVNGRSILKIRIEKLMEPKKNLKEDHTNRSGKHFKNIRNLDYDVDTQDGVKIAKFIDKGKQYHYNVDKITSIRRLKLNTISIGGEYADNRKFYKEFTIQELEKILDKKLKFVNFDKEIKENMKKNLKESKIKKIEQGKDSGFARGGIGDYYNLTLDSGEIIEVSTDELMGRYKELRNRFPGLEKLNKFLQNKEWKMYESKQFSLAQTVKKILKENEYKSKLDKQFKNEHGDLSIIKRNAIKSDNSGPYATTATSIDEYDVVSLSEKKYDKNYILNWAREIWKSSSMVDRKVDKVMAFKDMWTVTVTTTVWQN